jgi:hypothetical protein
VDMMCEVFILAPADVFGGEGPSPYPPTSFTDVPGADEGRPTVCHSDHGAH